MRILVTGDVRGEFEKLFKRVNNLKAKGKTFDVLFCIGDFFGANIPTEDPVWLSYLRGEQLAPIPTYILGPNKVQHVAFYEDHSGYEICHNITYLGKTGVYDMTAETDPIGAKPISIAYVSGVEGLSSHQTQQNHTFQEKEIRRLVENVQRKHPRGIDILLTSSWPSGISNYIKADKENLEKFAGQGPQSELISYVAAACKPRYHFSALHECYYERLPYRNHIVLRERNKHVTRFFSLAHLTNTTKMKWLYAFNLLPMLTMPNLDLTSQPEGTTENPYQEVLVRRVKRERAEKRKIMDSEEHQRNNATGYRWDVELMAQDFEKEKNRNAPLSAKVKDRGTDFTCWFCLGSEKVEKHLVISIAKHSYLALAKGGLDKFHCLVLPISHQGSSLDCLPECLEEIELYKSALVKFYRSHLRKAAVFFERNYRSDHYQLQCCPVSEDSVPHLADTFRDQALSITHAKISTKKGKYSRTVKGQELAIAFTTLESENRLDDLFTSDTPYFYVEIPDTSERLVHKIESWFPLQFGRQVLACPDVLNDGRLIDWKKCVLAKEEETEVTGEFRRAFAQYDPFSG